ncbi:hypothetical protein GIB67_003920 [Kingdonia uniflora]|uniref:ATPase F1/V1/A1 complex alpha/beta subunit N-terminal domain-containing protein n=1 Tax=Kingdonia uniflora TaxID=39325 RepID=A0A7J7LKA7_9MAGN|nr:hypothetical protein GIB67_003920 [Kingdonia uniflora]
MVTLRADKISNIIRERIEQYTREVKIVNTGTLQVGDDIARIHGLDEVISGELVEFDEGTIGISLNLESNNVGVILIGDGLMIQEGSSVKATGRIAQIPMIESYLGRVVNVLAKPIDGGGKISASESRLIESPTPDKLTASVVHEKEMASVLTFFLNKIIGIEEERDTMHDKMITKGVKCEMGLLRSEYLECFISKLGALTRGLEDQGRDIVVAIVLEFKF